MARRRIVYGALLLAAALFQIYSDHYLAGFVFALTAALPWVSLLLSLPAMLSCEVRVSPYHPAARRGETSWWLLDVGNRWRMPVARISIRMQMRNCMTGEGRRAKLKLSGGSQGLHLAEPADLAHCGRLECRIERVRVCDYLGLFAIRPPLPEPAVLLSMPAPGEAGPLPVPAGGQEGSAALRPRLGGGPGEDYDLRPYRPGDPVRMIHWKLSSKRGDLVIREVLESIQAVPVLTFDRFGAPDTMDAVLDRLDAVSHALLERQRSHWVCWVEPADGVPRAFYVSCEREWMACLTAAISLPLAEAGVSSLEQPVPLDSGEPVFYIHVTAEEQEVAT